MPRFDYDLFTIGAGSGGVAASRRAAAYGAKVAICEESRIGGTCVLRGCVPKKLMVYASSFRSELEDAAAWGWSVPDPQLNWARLVAAKDSELARLTTVYERLLGEAGVAIVRGRGTVIDAHTVEVEGTRYTAQRILIATGGWPSLPAIPGIEHAMSSNEALELARIPSEVAVVGGGYIAVEFAGIFRGVGANVVQIIRAPRVLRGFDEDVRLTLGDELAKRGIELVAGRCVTAITRTPDGRLDLVLDDGSRRTVGAVLFATGRRPLTRGLGLEEVGVTLDSEHAVVVDSWSRTSVPSIWAVGDVTQRPALTPVAITDGRAFAETEFHDNPTEADDRAIPTAVFSQPAVATVGLTEAAARARSDEPIDVYVTKFRPMKYVIPDRDRRTMMKLVVERRSGVVLGVHMVGLDAPEIIQGFAVAIRCGATKQQFDATVGIHPTSAEELVTMSTPTR